MAAAVLARRHGHVIDGQLTPGGFSQFNLYLAMLFLPLRMLGMWIGQVQRAIASGERIFEVLDVEPEIADPPQPKPLPDGAARPLRGRHVRLRPRRGRCCAASTSTSTPGQTVALIGRTGCGKTTLTSLIPRFYEPQAGRVLLDGVDVRELALEDLRRQVGHRRRGDVPVLDDRAREHRLRRALGHRRGGRAGRPPGAGARLHHGAPRRLRHAGRRARPDPLRRPAAAHRHRPGPPARPARAHPRRRHRLGRRLHRGPRSSSPCAP